MIMQNDARLSGRIFVQFWRKWLLVENVIQSSSQLQVSNISFAVTFCAESFYVGSLFHEELSSTLLLKILNLHKREICEETGCWYYNREFNDETGKAIVDAGMAEIPGQRKGNTLKALRLGGALPSWIWHMLLIWWFLWQGFTESQRCMSVIHLERSFV